MDKLRFQSVFSMQALAAGIVERPDYFSIVGVKVLAGMIVDNPDLNLTTEQKNHPEKLKVNTIPGMGSVAVRWIVSGSEENYTITVDSAKGGVAQMQGPK